MPVYPTQSARFADILLAVKRRLQDQLAALLTLDANTVRIVKAGGYKLNYAGDRCVRVRSVRGLYFGDSGGGRIAMPVTRFIAIDCFTRGGLDPAGEDDVALTEEGQGHYDLEEAVASALAIHTPRSDPDPPGEPANLTFEPMHPQEVPQDDDAPDLTRYSGYLVSTIYFDARYVSRLTQ